MIHSTKILFIIILFFISCDENKTVQTQGCIDQDACNTNASATIDNGSCEYPEENFDCDGNCIVGEDCTGECGGNAVVNEFCYDSDEDGLGYGVPLQFCDQAPDNWVNNCDDDTDDCIGIKDDCGECNGDNQSKDCMDVCFGLYVLDFNDTCCSNLDIQHTTGELGALDVC